MNKRFTFLRAVGFAVMAALALPSTSQAQTNPPLTNIAIWLKADANVAFYRDAASGNDYVSSWTDSATGRVYSSTGSPNQPRYIANSINGKSVIQFNVNNGVGTPLLGVCRT